MRCFVAVWPPEEVLDAIAALPRPAVVGARWTTADQWHVTLRFLGEVEEESLPSLLAAISDLGLSPVRVRLGPAVELLNPRIVSVPVAGLEVVGPAVIDATARFGRPPEVRPFNGHLTLARLKGVRRRDLGDVLGSPIEESWTVDEVHVVRSILSPKGARYESVDAVRLAGSALQVEPRPMGGDRGELEGTTWRLEQVGSAAADETVRSTLTFGADGRVSGRGGVNQFGGSFRVADDTIEFGEMMQTLMAGPPEAMEQEQRFLEALSGNRAWSMSRDGRVLTVGDARLRRVE